MTAHEQVRVRNPWLGWIEVDRGMATLLRMTWRLGIETALSCQRQPGGWVWISFPTSSDAEWFLDTVAHHLTRHGVPCTTDAVYRRMAVGGLRDSWRYSISVIDYARFDEPEERAIKNLPGSRSTPRSASPAGSSPTCYGHCEGPCTPRGPSPGSPVGLSRAEVQGRRGPPSSRQDVFW